MGIQINGNTDIISATDGSLTIQGASGNLTGNLTGTATTAQGLTGTPNITVGSIIASSATISGNVSVAGTLTYEDVTNVDSLGIVTARTGVRIDAGGLVVVGVTTVAAGSTAAPSITPTGDSDTGIFFPSADTIAFGEGGVEAIRINSSGNLGIGTNNPTVALQLSPDAVISNVNYNNSLSSVAGAALTVAQFGYSNANGSFLRIKASRLSNGSSWTTASTKLVQVTDVTEQGYIEFNPSGGNYGIAFGGLNDNTGVISEWLRIDKVGRVTTPSQVAFHVPKITGDTLTTTAAKLTFGSATYDVGSNYSDANDRFTAPVAGKYFFYTSINILNSGNASLIYIRKNGSTYGQIYYAATNYPRMDFNPVGIIDLAASDYVEIFGSISSGTVSVDNAGYFGGYLLG